MAKQQIPSEEKKNLILETIDDRKAENPVVIDLRDKVNIADFFIICTGLAVPHIRAIAEHVLEMVDDHNMPKPAVSGEEVAEWVLVDFGDVILHIMRRGPLPVQAGGLLDHGSAEGRPPAKP